MTEPPGVNNGVPALHGVHHIAVQVRDLDVSCAFYQGVLGLKETRRQAHSVWLEAGGTIVMLERAPSDAADAADGPAHALDAGAASRARVPPWKSARTGLHLLALAIDARDRTAWRARLAAAGIALEAETAFTLYVRDPDGTRVGLSHYPVPAPDASDSTSS